ncbi:hypothetical protein [uncultured Desulfobacter sp.]|uniref:hypothetical protein n=1 Tax=uncultured Desulfobacter sp. TaxID=240139 RepID=UPI002AAB57F9|nr:hypothetical protein [uncultured Desulfobacter sp.]
MKISWQIRKKRGNFRPGLSYEFTLEPFEKKLAIHAVQVESLIPMLPRPHLSYCLPGEDERAPGWQPSRFHVLQVPHFKDGHTRGFLRLPFRERTEFPEVEASFKNLRREYEIRVCEAYGHSPVNQGGVLDITDDTRSKISAKVTAHRFLSSLGQHHGASVTDFKPY